MRGLIFLSSFLIFSSTLTSAEELSCKTEEEYQGGSKSGVEVKLQLDHHRVTAISYSNYNSNGEEGGAYFCSFDASSTDHESVWTQSKDTIRVHLLEDSDESDEKDGSTFEITKTKTGYVLNFVEMSRYYCGFGAEYPSTVRIEKGKKECVTDDPDASPSES